MFCALTQQKHTKIERPRKNIDKRNDINNRKNITIIFGDNQSQRATGEIKTESNKCLRAHFETYYKHARERIEHSIKMLNLIQRTYSNRFRKSLGGHKGGDIENDKTLDNKGELCALPGRPNTKKIPQRQQADTRQNWAIKLHAHRSDLTGPKINSRTS